MESHNTFFGNPLLQVPKSSLESALIIGHLISYGLRITSFTNRVFFAESKGSPRLAFLSSRGLLTSVAGSEMCRNKAITKTLLELHSIPTAPGKRISKGGREPVMRFVEEHGWPVVVKPVSGVGGDGVTAGISSFNQLWEAIRHASGARGFLIEKHVPGDDYRFLVLNGKVIGVWGRDAANVIGDGTSSISELIDMKNAIRSSNPHLIGRPIKKSSLVQDHLRYADLKLDDVPVEGKKVYLRSAANLSAGGDNIEITEEVHPSLIEIAVDAARVVPGADLLGLDLLLDDPFSPASGQNVNICEINDNPGISAHDFPMFGAPRNTARQYVDFLVQKYDVATSPYSTKQSYKIVSKGEFNQSKYSARAVELGRRLSLRLDFIGPQAGSVALEVFGDSAAIAAFVGLCAGSSVEIGPMDALIAEKSA